MTTNGPSRKLHRPPGLCTCADVKRIAFPAASTPTLKPERRVSPLPNRAATARGTSKHRVTWTYPTAQADTERRHVQEVQRPVGIHVTAGDPVQTWKLRRVCSRVIQR